MTAQGQGATTAHASGSTPSSGRRESFWGDLSDRLDDWLAIEPDGSITAFSGKVELGTGVRTALAQIVADELDVPLERVHMVMGDTARTPDEGYTAGSMTISTSGDALRNAAAEARRIMLRKAARRLRTTTQSLSAKNGIISIDGHPTKTVSYGDLMGGKAFNHRVTDRAPLKPFDSYDVVGSVAPREDLPRKVAGEPSFIQDLRVPGMLHARLVRPPGPAAKLISVDRDSVRSVPGFVQLVQRGNYVAVIAEREEQAAAELKVEWEPAAAFPEMRELHDYLRNQQTEDTVLAKHGNLTRALRDAARQVRATYYQPYHAHASIGPSCAVADVRGDQATIWASTPGPYPLRGAIAQLLRLPPESVHIIYVEGAGSYGQNGADDAAADAGILSQAVQRPVRVQWTREEEFAWEPKAPAMVMEVEGGLDPQGNVVAWDYHVFSPSHVARARFAGQLVPAQLLAGERAPQSRFSFGAERNAPTNYAFPLQRVTVHYVPDTPLRASSFRSLGGAENTFANESFMDELASLAGADPVEFRLRYLTDDRERAVLKSTAEKAGWDPRPSPRPGASDPTTGRGVAFARYENEEAIVACVVEVQVDRGTGNVTVDRVVVAHDCGLIINPDGVENQIEGNVVQSLSRALKEEVRFDRYQITSVDWDSYPILTFSEVPQIEIVLLNRPDQPAVGAGEPSQVTTAAALANAIFDATGARLRRIPFTPARVKAALQGRPEADLGAVP
jgi:nicotinate dehydrogenase subunit B